MREQERGASSAPPDAARARGSRLALAVLSVLVGAALGALLLGRAPAERPQPTVETVVRDTPNVITAVRELAVLESVRFHVERVIDLRDRQSLLFGLVEIEDALLLVAAADVVAGVDLGALREGDVEIDTATRSAVLTLPPPGILSARLDNDRTYVHTRSTDALMRPGLTLETRARQEAERSLREAAIAGGILAQAQTNAERTVATLVRSLGFTQVEVRFRAE